MAKTYPVIERAGNRVTVLARSAEEAHQAVTEQLGAGCTIVSVERVRSGGLGGFFATELVRLVAAPRGAEMSGPAKASSFASAEELVFALPGGGGEFAARLTEELAVLTAKGIAAAEATMGGPVGGSSVPYDRHTPEAGWAAKVEAYAMPAAPVEAWATVTEPVRQIVVEPRHEPMIETEPMLPSPDELRWGSEEEPARRWRRSARSDRTAGSRFQDGSFGDPGGPAPGWEPSERDELELELGDAALLAACAELDDDPQASSEPRCEPEPVVYEASGDHREWSGWDATRTVPEAGAFDDLPLTSRDVDGTTALVAQMLETELEIEDRAVTPRAQLIREGRSTIARVSQPEPEDRNRSIEIQVEPSLEPDHVVDRFEAAIITPLVERMPDLPARPVPQGAATAASPAAGEPTDRSAVLPAPSSPRTRVLVPTPVTPVTSWSAPTLRAFGVPDGIVERMTAQHPADDVEWTVAFMLSVRELCRRLPSGPSVLVGPSGANLARQLGLISLSGDELGVSGASVASPNAGPVTLRRAAGGRHVHLVVGGNWHHLVTVRPTVVSAATDHDLLEALRVAEAWGATLGWTLDGHRYVRIDPFLLAGRVRQLLPSAADVMSTLDPALFAPFA